MSMFISDARHRHVCSAPPPLAGPSAAPVADVLVTRDLLPVAPGLGSVSARPSQSCDSPASAWPSMVPLTASLGSVL